MARLNNQVIIITGGASGLGKAVVERCLQEGARVAVIDKSEDALAALKEAVTKDRHGDCILTCQADVRSIGDIQAAVQQTIEKFGHLDCSIGNAGLWDYSVKLDDMPPDSVQPAFEELFGVNVLGYINLAKATIPALVRSGGSMIFTVSNAGYHPAGGGVLYTASKHAVVGLIKQLAFELAPAIRVNGVAPGPIHSHLRGPQAMGLADKTIDQLDLPTNAARYTAIGRVPETREYAGAFVHLASREDSGPSTGGVIQADCGIGIRGLNSPAAGRNLAAKYAKDPEAAR